MEKIIRSLRRVILLIIIILLFSYTHGESDDQCIAWDDYFYLLYQYEGHHINQFYGDQVHLAGDLNNDGFDDIMVGVPGEEINGEEYIGKVYIYSGLDGSFLYSFQGEHEKANCGQSISGIGDTDNDGYREFLIGAPGTGQGVNSTRGKVYHYSGKDGSLINEYLGEGIGHRLGGNLDCLGDVNGDGIDEFIADAQGYDVNPPPFNIGAIYVFNTITQQMLHKFTGRHSGESLLMVISKAGDIDKDGYNDFAYLFPYEKSTPDPVGVLTIRSGKDGLEIKKLSGSDPNEPLEELAFGGDVNKDGWPDLLIGQPLKDCEAGYDAGCVYVYSGKDLSFITTIYGTVEMMWLGDALSTAGDIGHDGYEDILAGAPGHNKLGVWYGGTANIYSGKDGSIIATLMGESYVGSLGRAVHGGRDVNADGLPDVIIASREDVNGIQSAGKAYVYVSKSLKATDQVPLGTDLELNLHVPAQPYGFYYLGFALDKEPGIPVGTRILPLSLDILLLVTFGNPAFSGNLDHKGKKRLTYHMPDDPGLSGLTFYGAFLTTKSGAPCGVGTISNPEKIVLN
jgi:hypothetical protein